MPKKEKSQFCVLYMRSKQGEIQILFLRKTRGSTIYYRVKMA